MAMDECLIMSSARHSPFAICVIIGRYSLTVPRLGQPRHCSNCSASAKKLRFVVIFVKNTETFVRSAGSTLRRLAPQACVVTT